MKAEDVNVKETPHGNLRIIVPDDESDSLVVLTVKRSHGILTVEVGLRGNFDVRKRPIRRTYVTMPAPDVTPEERARRKRRGLNGP